MYADAVWDRTAQEADELSFRVGDVIEILDMTEDLWWLGSVKEQVKEQDSTKELSGWFPASFVRVSTSGKGWMDGWMERREIYAYTQCISDVQRVLCVSTCS